MADLDDFFAKKDRKKAKGKKFATTDEVAKKLEETGKRLEKPKPKEKPANPEGEDSQHTEDEDEWKEFEEEKKDYSGLKIGHLTVNDSVDAESDDERGTFEVSSDGECGEGGTKYTGPWKKPDLPPETPEVVPTPPAPPVAAAAATTTAAAATASTGNSYKAPHLRNQPTFASPRPRGRNVAPDINSEEYFPTLNSKPQPQNNGSGPWGSRRRREEGVFEEVRNRGGSRSYNVPESQAQTPKLSLGNKYGALSQDQS
ncbi:PREDICTED: protein CDV3 homolog [Cyphomyrmex costatus]|uniref:Protein CDV3 like protein n=1 Tax=Cyphomyrmex costatus TaxID=456900 RepID=A0A195CTS7_9HYME|nr:PREDICTED: protein CDV3 homolog [Cyphomyrmex costatus]KYN04098.1 Protein CDV3 like protein [Cyphomyrmex costatus]